MKKVKYVVEMIVEDNTDLGLETTEEIANFLDGSSFSETLSIHGDIHTVDVKCLRIDENVEV